MKTSLHIQNTNSYSIDDLFYTFWNKQKLFEEKPDAPSAFEKISFVSFDNTYNHHYIVQGHFCGIFNFLLKPANIPHSEKIDQDFLGYIIIEKGLLNFYCSTLKSGDRPFEILEKATKGIDYREVDDVDVDDKKLFDWLGYGLLRKLISIDQDKICQDGTSYDGQFTIKNLIQIDEPVMSLYYKRNPFGDYFADEYCTLAMPYDLPGKTVPKMGPYDSFFKRKKFPIVLEEFKKYFMDLLSKVQNGERSTV